MRIGYVLFGSSALLDDNGIRNRFSISTKQVMELTGANLGNLAFKFGAKRLIHSDCTIEYITYSDDPAKIRDKVDVLVLPEANLINPNVNYSNPAKFIEQVDKPVFILGVGAQASNFETTITVTEGTLRFLKAVASRTPYICVRGEYTKSQLEALGITNVMALGCPSLMINQTRHLWQKIAAKAKKIKDFNNFVVTEGIYPVKSRNEKIDQLEKRLFNFVLSRQAHYLGQVQTSVISHGLNNIDCIQRDDMYYLKQYLASGTSEEEFYRIASERFKAFTKVDEWMMFYKGTQAVIGTRIHGNFLAIQSEVPALPITHDTRTTELCQTMRIPYLDLKDGAKIANLSDVNDAFKVIREVNYHELDEHRTALANKYIDVMGELGIPSSKILNHVAGK